MNKKDNGTNGLPSKEQLQEFLQNSTDPLNKREIARAFGIKGQNRTGLRKLLREMTEEGAVAQNPSKSYAAPDSLPDTALIEIEGLDGDGELRARPVSWHGKGPAPVIYVTDKKKSAAGLKAGDRALAKLKKIDRKEYEARILKSHAAEEENRPVVGIYKPYKDGGYVTPTDRRNHDEYFIPAELSSGAEDGELVTVGPVPPTQKYPKSKNPARVLERLGKKDDPRLISLIAIHSHGIPTRFSKEAMKEAEGLFEPDLSGGREDLRDIPLVTIDGADARDFDDAVYAAPDTDPKNAGGWKLAVAIADVSYYVRPQSFLDKDAYERGNSTYFADRVVPMLPERLSNDLCSLKPKVNRACLAVRMTIDKNAHLVAWKFTRGLMRSVARLTYEQVEDAHRGNPDETTGPLLESVIRPLYKAYSLLKRARQQRGALELDLPERKAIIENGVLKNIVPRRRLDSHQLIEEFMILANVATALELEKKHAPCLYRVHDRPSFERIEAARLYLRELGYTLPKTDDLHPRSINTILKSSSDRGEAELVHTMMLRAQSPAIYHPDNIGHFGLALEKYAHFTSPIRRYADLIVHRSLVKACNLGDGGLTPQETEHLYDISEHISQTERRSMLAERDVMDRFTAQYLKEHIGSIFKGKISGLNRAGLFVSLDDTGADGFVPLRSLPQDYYIHDEARHALVGKRTRRVFRLTDPVVVRLLEAEPLRGSTVFELAESGGEEHAPRRHERQRPEKRRGKRRRR